MPDLNLDEPDVFTNYKDTFLIEELTKRSSISSSSSSSMQTEDQQDVSFKIHVDSSSFENSKKILKKRANIENNKIEHHQEVIKLVSILDETKHTTSTEDFTQEEYRIPISVELKEEKNDESRVESDIQNENLPNLKSYRSFNSSLQNRYQQRLLFNRYGPYQHSANENPTSIIRIRRVFDGETLKINQMNLNPNESRLEHLKHATERNIKSANSSQIKWRPKRLIKSAEQRPHVDVTDEIVTNLVESLVTNTNTKTPSDTINESAYLRDTLLFKKELKQETRKPASATQRTTANTAKQANSQAGAAAANTRKTKSAGSKVRFNENLLQNQMKNEKLSDDKKKEKLEEISNFAISESIVESKIIESKETSHEKLSEFNDAASNQPEKYQKSMSPTSFAEETKSYTMSSQEREHLDNEEEEEIINEVVTANLDTTSEAKSETEVNI